MNQRQRQRGRFGGAVLLTSLEALGTGLTADAGASADVAVDVHDVTWSGPQQAGSFAVTVTNPAGMASPSTYSGTLDPDSQGGFTTPALADGESTTLGFGQLAPGAYVLTVSGPNGSDVSNITIESCAVEPTAIEAATATTTTTTTTTTTPDPRQVPSTTIVAAPATDPAVGQQLPATGTAALGVAALSTGLAALGRCSCIAGQRPPSRKRR